MKKFHLPLVVFLVLVTAAVPAVSAAFVGENGTIVIEHIGENQVTWGDAISLTGTSTVSDTLSLKLMGPGLPSDGVSILNLSDSTGQLVPVGSDSSWIYIWRTSWTTGTLPSTGKYTIRAVDAIYPDKYADFSIYFTKPEMTLNLTPTSIETGDYSTVSGKVIATTDTVKVNVTKYGDATVLKMYDADVDSSNNYNLPVRFILSSGKYNVTVTNPADGKSLTAVLTIANAAVTSATTSATITTTPTIIAITSTPSATITMASAEKTTTASETSWFLPIVIAVILVVIIAAAALYFRKGGKSKDRDL